MTSNQETPLVSSQHVTRSPGVWGPEMRTTHRPGHIPCEPSVLDPRKNPTSLSASIWMFRVYSRTTKMSRLEAVIYVNLFRLNLFRFFFLYLRFASRWLEQIEKHLPNGGLMIMMIYNARTWNKPPETNTLSETNISPENGGFQ